MLDERRALLQLRDQLGHLVRHRDGFREPLLFGTRRRELGLQRGGVCFVLRQLRRDLGTDLGEHRLQDSIAQDVLLQVIDERGLDLRHWLVHGHGTDGAAALVVFGAAVAKHANLVATVCLHACCRDRATTRTALRDPGQRILRGRATRTTIWLARGKSRVHREPRRVVDDAPLGDLDRDHLARLGLHPNRAATLPNLLDPAVDVHASIASVEQNGPDCARCPRSAAATPGRRRGYAVVIQLVRDLFQPATCEVLAIDALDDGRLRIVDDGGGVSATGTIALPFELVPVAGPARDAPGAHSIAERLARPRADRFELHLVTRALDERGRLIDRVREHHLLAARVVEEPATAIANEVANDERHFDRIAAEARLIAAEDHVAALGVGKQLAQATARQKVVAGATVIDVVDTRLVGETHPRDVLVAALRLHVEAELLLAFVVLGAPSVGPDRHLIPLCSRLNAQARRNHPAAFRGSQLVSGGIALAKISS